MSLPARITCCQSCHVMLAHMQASDTVRDSNTPQVQNVVEMPEHDHMSLMDASRHCNREIIGKVQQVICFAFHDSRLLLETCAEAKDSKKIVTLFYLD